MDGWKMGLLRLRLIQWSWNLPGSPHMILHMPCLRYQIFVVCYKILLHQHEQSRNIIHVNLSPHKIYNRLKSSRPGQGECLQPAWTGLQMTKKLVLINLKRRRIGAEIYWSLCNNRRMPDWAMCIFVLYVRTQNLLCKSETQISEQQRKT